MTKSQVVIVVFIVLLISIPTAYWYFLSPSDNPQIESEEVFTAIEFELPTGVYFPDDGSNSVYVTELAGRVVRFSNTEVSSSAEVILDISSRIGQLEDEEGLVGLIFDPNFKQNQYIYLHYTTHSPLQTIVSRFTMNSSGLISLSSEQILIKLDQPYPNHNGGGLIFGQDKYLYIGLGDGGLFYDPSGHGQNTSTLFGTVLRIDPDHSTPTQNYSIPSDNPFLGNSNVRDEIYSFGLRNPYKMSQDFRTGKIWLGDVGQDDREEVNILQPGGNYGWSSYEGTLCLDEQNCDLDYIEPYYEYTHDFGNAIIGGHVYRGNEITNLEGKYIFADWLNGEIYWIPSEGTDIRRHLLLEVTYLVSSFGQDLNNELYVTAFDGRIFRLHDVQ